VSYPPWLQLWDAIRPRLELKGDGRPDAGGWVWARCIDGANHRNSDAHFSMRINIQTGGVRCMSQGCPVGPNLNNLAERLGVNGHREDDRPAPGEAMRRLAQERLFSEEALRDKYSVRAVSGGWAFAVDDPDAHGHPHIKRFSWWPGEPHFWWPKGSGVKAKGCVYGLSHVAAGAETVYVAAGEVDCITLLEASYPAVTFLAGENSVPSPKAIRKLLDRGIQSLCFVYDLDEAGRKGAIDVGRACVREGLQISILTLPDDLGEKGDVSDLWRRCGGNRDAFVQALESCPVTPLEEPAVEAQAEESGETNRHPVVCPLSEFMEKDWGSGEPIVEGWLSTGDIAVLYGQINHGKTLEAAEFALGVGTGRPLFGRVPTIQGTVLFVEEDCHPQKLQRYLSTLMQAYGIEEASVFIWERQFLRLDDEDSANAFIEEVLRLRPRLIILDAFLDLHSGDGFTGRELRPILDRIEALPQLLPCAVLVLDHTRKEATGNKLHDPIDALYGGRLKSAMADKMIFTKKISDVPVRFEISMVKTRDEPRAPIKVTFSSEEGFSINDTPATLTPSARAVLEWAQRQPHGAKLTKAAIKEGTGLSLRAVNGAIPELRYNRMLEDAGKQGRANLYRLVAWNQGKTAGGGEKDERPVQRLLSDLAPGGIHQETGGID